MGVGGKGLEAGGGHGGVHQAHNAEGGAVDDPADGGGQAFGQVRQDLFGGLAGVAHGQAEDDGPQQDADEVGIGQGGDGVADGVVQQGGQHLADAAGGSGGTVSLGQQQGGGEQEAGDDRAQGGQEGAHQIEYDDGAHVGAAALLTLSQGVDDDEEHQQGGQGFQSAHEQGA